MFKDSLIDQDLIDSDIDTVVQTWSTVEENLLVHNDLVEAVIYGMYKSLEDKEEEDKAEV